MGLVRVFYVHGANAFLGKIYSWRKANGHIPTDEMGTLIHVGL